ncbi:MAG TPA: DUF4340 domain-containing protein [Stellaceae bacterium]|nr:DUF4340 domain-containing protein [Stellaceae bacterium]
MQRRTFNLLLAGTAVSAAAAGFALVTGDRYVSSAPPGQRALPDLAGKLSELAWIRISRGAMTINFNLIAGHWAVVEKGNYPAAEERLRKLLGALAVVELVEPKTDRAELLPRLDLDDPANGKSTLVALQDRAGAQVGQLIIGRRRPSSLGGGDAGVYVRKPGTDQAWLARGSFDLSGDVLDWIDRQIIDLSAANIASIVLTAPDGAATVLSRAASDAAFAIEGSSTPPDAKSAALLAGALIALELDDVKPAAEMSIPADGAATAAFTTFDGLIVGTRLSPPEAGDWIAFDVTGFGKAEDEAKTLSAKLSRWSFRIPPERAKLLRMTLADLQPHGS